MIHRMRFTAAALGAASLLAVTGCYEEVDTADTGATADETAPQEGPVNQQMSGTTSGSLGKSKGAAEKTVSDLEKRQADIEKEIEDP
jgi:hypothetical protein